MSYGLSDRDRERLERGRTEAAAAMAKERRRIEKVKDDEAERERQSEEYRQRYGPLEVTGPDGVRVMLIVAPSGGIGLVYEDGPDSLITLVVYLAMVVLNAISHYVFFRGGSTVHVLPEGQSKVKLRFRHKAQASERMLEVADVIKRHGIRSITIRPT